MGGAVSSGRDNDDLIDKLKEHGYIKSTLVEEVFRTVDRGRYLLKEHRDQAYKDLAWKHDNIHLSAPCIYSEVMEALQFQSGLSFLNMGCGTGYLSTMAGLIIGSSGVNHGIELHSDVVDYARMRLTKFIKNCETFDRFEFCEPSFVTGNCLNLSPDTQLYDRVYCGAACPVSHVQYLKNLIKVKGILVMPFEDQLQQYVRTTATTWDVKNILPVSFAPLILPENNGKDIGSVKSPAMNPRSLHDLCRLQIRQLLRRKLGDKMAPPPRPKRLKRKRRRRAVSEGYRPRSRPTHRHSFEEDLLQFMARRNNHSSDEDDNVDDGHDDENREDIDTQSPRPTPIGAASCNDHRDDGIHSQPLDVRTSSSSSNSTPDEDYIDAPTEPSVDTSVESRSRPDIVDGQCSDEPDDGASLPPDKMECSPLNPTDPSTESAPNLSSGNINANAVLDDGAGVDIDEVRCGIGASVDDENDRPTPDGEESHEDPVEGDNNSGTENGHRSSRDRRDVDRWDGGGTESNSLPSVAGIFPCDSGRCIIVYGNQFFSSRLSQRHGTNNQSENVADDDDDDDDDDDVISSDDEDEDHGMDWDSSDPTSTGVNKKSVGDLAESNVFRQCVLRLELPPALKDYLLYYRDI